MADAADAAAPAPAAAELEGTVSMPAQPAADATIQTEALDTEGAALDHTSADVLMQETSAMSQEEIQAAIHAADAVAAATAATEVVEDGAEGEENEPEEEFVEPTEAEDEAAEDGYDEDEYVEDIPEEIDDAGVQDDDELAGFDVMPEVEDADKVAAEEEPVIQVDASEKAAPDRTAAQGSSLVRPTRTQSRTESYIWSSVRKRCGRFSASLRKNWDLSCWIQEKPFI